MTMTKLQVVVFCAVLVSSLLLFQSGDAEDKKCEVKSPITILGCKVCNYTDDVGKQTMCNNCVKRIFGGASSNVQCHFDKVEFPPKIGCCQKSIRMKEFEKKLIELRVDQYVGQIEKMLSQIPKLQDQFCSKSGALNSFMAEGDATSEEDAGPGMMDTMKNSEFGNSVSQMKNSDAGKAVGDCLVNIGTSTARRQMQSTLKELKTLMDKICGKEAICGEIKKCMEEILGYVVNYCTRRKRGLPVNDFWSFELP